ncbi:MAG: carbohydrate-binding protein [Bacteroidales bacterium]|nr:carbohydrate-binding protein [Bacteroidales bacterium]
MEIASLGADQVEYSDINLEPSTTYSYRVLAYNNQASSAYSNEATATTNPIQGGGGTYEAEHYTSQSGNTVFEHLDASNDQAVDFGGNGAWIEWNNVNEGAGYAQLTFRYYNGSSASRPCQVIVNGTLQATAQMAPSGGWATAGFESVVVVLNEGANAIRFMASTNAGGPNVDKMDVVVDNIYKPVVPPIISFIAPDSNALFTEGNVIALSAEASDEDGSVSKVVFAYQENGGLTMLAELTNAPFTFEWENAEIGAYKVYAIAVDNEGNKSADSITIAVQEKHT